MTTIAVYQAQMEFNRTRTLTTLDDIAKQPNPAAILGWRPGPGRAQIAWQLMHVAVTEELFATERMIEGATAAYPDLVPASKGAARRTTTSPMSARFGRCSTDPGAHLMATLGKDSRTPTCQLSIRSSKIAAGHSPEMLQVLCWHMRAIIRGRRITYNLWKSKPAAAS
jgi:hypothetical protein